MSRRIVFIESNTTGTGSLFFSRSLSLGLEPILISEDPTRYPFLEKFTSLKIRQRSVAAVLAALGELSSHGAIKPIEGVWSSSDQGAELAALVARELGLPHADPTAIAVCRDKFAARKNLHKAGLSEIAYALVFSGEEAARFAASFNCPSVVKPRSSTGSIGVKLCSSPEEAGCHAAALLNDVDRQGVLIEAFVDGPEYSVEIFNGISVGVTRKILGLPPTFIEIGHDFPSPGVRADLDAIAKHAERAVATIGYSEGPAHVEIRLSEGRPTVIEINPRLAGGLIPELVRRAAGIDLITTSIRFACGLPYDLTASRTGAAAIRFLLRSTPSAVRCINGLPDARSMAGIVEASALDRAFGRRGSIEDFRDRVAYVIAEARSPEEAGRLADHALGLLHDVSTPQSMETDSA